MRRHYITLLAVLAVLCASAAAPNGSGTYYQNANGKKGAALKSALCGIIYNRTEKSYDYLWTAFYSTDVRSNGKIWDMYSNITNYTPVTSGSSYSEEGDCYNREHSFPQSWFGGNAPMYTDLHHIYPTDGFVNGKRSNYPFGEVGNASYTSANGFSKLGTCAVSGYTGTVFEPADEYKGDFARTYFYMVTCYEQKLADWVRDFGGTTEVDDVLDGTTYPALQLWQLNMLLTWAKDDPVSEKEINRNTAVKNIQGNRNPFIDYPGLEQYIWGSKKSDAFSYNNYVEPTEYTGYNAGGGQTGGSGTYTLTITADDFNTTSYAANNTEKTSQAVCTTDDSKTYEVTWTSNQVMQQGGNMQWKKSEGYIYNSTDLGTITGVTVTSSGGTFTTYYGTEEQPSSSTTPGGGFFKTKVGSATGTTSKVEITFTITADEPELVPSEAWIETPLDELTSSDVFVIVGTNSFGSYAMANDGRISAPSAVGVTVEGNELIYDVADNLMWNISGDATDGYVFYPDGSTSTWLYCTNNNNGVKVGTGDNKTFKQSNGYLKNVATSRYLGIYDSQDWRCYTSYSGSSNIAGQSFKFYRHVVQNVSVGEKGYATMVALADLAVPSGLEAFAVQVNGSSARLVPIESAIPEGEAVVVKASEGTYHFSAAPSAASVAGNQLVAATRKVRADGTQYCLADGASGIGFYKVQAGIEIPAGKAYLVVESAVKPFYGFEEDDATSLNEELRIKNEEFEGAAIFNLAGQMVNGKSVNGKLPRGINIVGGKKVLK